MVLVRPQCESDKSVPEFDGYDVSSGQSPFSLPHTIILASLSLPPPDLLGQAPPKGSESTLSLPSSLFSDVFTNGSVANCSEVGVVSLVYGGIGPPLSLNEEQLLASIGCSSNTSRQAEDIW